MIIRAATIAKRAWEYALRHSEFLRFVFLGEETERSYETKEVGPNWPDTDWEGND